MFNLHDNLKNKKFLIYGYGKSGSSAHNYLKKYNKILIYDDNKKPNKFYTSLKKNKNNKI